MAMSGLRFIFVHGLSGWGSYDGADGKTMEENPYVFEDSHLTTEDAQGVAVIYLLEDGRLAIEMTVTAMDGVKIGMLCDRVKAAE